jgi:predicted ester cyclase
MAINIHNHNKKFVGKLRAALYDCDEAALRGQLHEVFAPDAEIHLAFPFEDLDGPDGLYEQAYQPLLAAIPDLERRDFILMAGSDRDANWVGCAGHYMGVFERPWLDIPPTQHLVAMRYHEFFRVVDDQIVEMQALWDIPQVMMQASAWPMTPSLGVEWVIPGPAGQDGIIAAPYDQGQADASTQLVLDMVQGLRRSPDGFEAMQMEDFWHPKMNWYGPAGIGSMRRLWGFQNWHQYPFLRAMPDRMPVLENGYMFGDGDYVGFTAWPGMTMTFSGDGWLGIAPAGQKLTMRSLDFWRREGDVLRENWVLVDIPSVYDQLGVDIFARMREVTYARQHR